MQNLRTLFWEHEPWLKSIDWNVRLLGRIESILFPRSSSLHSECLKQRPRSIVSATHRDRWCFLKVFKWQVLERGQITDNDWQAFSHDPKDETWSHSFVSVHSCFSVCLSVHLPEVTCICRHRADRHTGQPVLVVQHPSRTMSCDMLFLHAQCEMFVKCFSSSCTDPSPTNQISHELDLYYMSSYVYVISNQHGVHCWMSKMNGHQRLCIHLLGLLEFENKNAVCWPM